jgi:hypothetical protein
VRLPGGENGADQQLFGMASRSLLQEHRHEGQDDGGEAGRQVHGGVSWRGRAIFSYPLRRLTYAAHRSASERLPNGQSRA